MHEVYQFLKQNRIGYLATTDAEGKPRKSHRSKLY